MAEVTYKPVIYKNRQNPDGSYDVKIRVTFKRKSSYLPTTETATKKELDKDLNIKDFDLLSKLYTLIIKLKKSEAKIDPFALDNMDVSEIVNFIKKDMSLSIENFRLPFVEYAHRFIATKGLGNARNYRSAMKSFCAFIGKSEFDISVITSSLMRRYESHLRSTIGENTRAVTLYTASIGAIHKAARAEFNDNELGLVRIKNPFEFYKPPKQRKTLSHKPLSVESIQKLIDIKDEISPRQKRFVDMCLLSFCLMGTNLPDLYTATRKGDIIHYNRAKTMNRRDDFAEMRIRLEPICKCIWEKYLDSGSGLAFNMWRTHKYMRSLTYVGHQKEEREAIAKRIGYDGPLTMYCFRHSWATIAYSIGIDKGIINDCLCHIDPNMSITDIYIKKDWSVLWKANRKVLKKFKWK